MKRKPAGCEMKRKRRSQSPSPPSANARIVLIPTRVASDVTNMEKTKNEAPSSSGACRGLPSLAAAAPPPPPANYPLGYDHNEDDFLAIRVKEESEKKPEDDLCKDDFVKKDQAEEMYLQAKSKPKAKPSRRKDGTWRTNEARGPAMHLSWKRGIPSDFIPIGPQP